MSEVHMRESSLVFIFHTGRLNEYSTIKCMWWCFRLSTYTIASFTIMVVRTLITPNCMMVIIGRELVSH